jgi:hypothetical protein
VDKWTAGEGGNHPAGRVFTSGRPRSTCVRRAMPRRFAPGTLRLNRSPIGRVAQAVDFAGIANTVGAPLLRPLCEEPALSLPKGRVPRTPAAAQLCHSIPERNLRPAFIHAHRPGFVQKIETITAPRHSSGAPTRPRFTVLRCIYLSFSTRFFVVHTLKS